MPRTFNSNSRPGRRGATLVESAILLPVFCLFIFTFMDLGLLTLRKNTLTAAAINVSRAVAIHSREYPGNDFPLGPESVNAPIDLLAGIPRCAMPPLPTMEAEDVRLQIQWSGSPDAPPRSTTVQLDYLHQSLLGALAPWHNTELSAVSKADIAI